MPRPLHDGPAQDRPILADDEAQQHGSFLARRLGGARVDFVTGQTGLDGGEIVGRRRAWRGGVAGLRRDRGGWRRRRRGRWRRRRGRRDPGRGGDCLRLGRGGPFHRLTWRRRRGGRGGRRLRRRGRRRFRRDGRSLKGLDLRRRRFGDGNLGWFRWWRLRRGWFCGGRLDRRWFHGGALRFRRRFDRGFGRRGGLRFDRRLGWCGRRRRRFQFQQKGDRRRRGWRRFFRAQQDDKRERSPVQRQRQRQGPPAARGARNGKAGRRPLRRAKGTGARTVWKQGRSPG